MSEQADRLIDLGLPEIARISATELRAAAAGDRSDALLVIHPKRASASALCRPGSSTMRWARTSKCPRSLSAGVPTVGVLDQNWRVTKPTTASMRSCLVAK